MVVLATYSETLMNLGMVLGFIVVMFVVALMAVLLGKKKRSTMSEGSAYGDDATRNTEWLQQMKQTAPEAPARPHIRPTAPQTAPPAVPAQQRPAAPAASPAPPRTAPPAQPPAPAQQPAQPSAPAPLPSQPSPRLPGRPLPTGPAKPAGNSFADRLRAEGNPNGPADPLRQFDQWENQP